MQNTFDRSPAEGRRAVCRMRRFAFTTLLSLSLLLKTETQRGPLYFTGEAGHNNNIPTGSPLYISARTMHAAGAGAREQTEAICALAAQGRRDMKFIHI